MSRTPKVLLPLTLLFLAVVSITVKANAQGTIQPYVQPTTVVAAKYFGTVAPCSGAGGENGCVGNFPGDLYTNTANGYEYVCVAPKATRAPACTTVGTTSSWVLTGAGGGVRAPATTTVGNVPQYADATGTALTGGLPVTQSGGASSVVETTSAGGVVASGPISSGTAVPTAWFTGAGIAGFPDTTCGGTIPATYGYLVDCAGVASWLHGSTTAPIQLTTAASKTTNNCAKFDANGNTIDAGTTCGGTTPTAVAAPWCIPWAGCTWGQNTKTMNLHESYFVKMVVPYPGSTVSQIGITLPCAGTAYAVMGFYDSTCTTLLGATTPLLLSNIAYNQMQFAAPVTLTAGSIVYLGMTSDGPITYNAPIIPSLPYLTVNENSTNYSVFQGNASTGSAGTLALPSACGTRTTVSTNVVVPNVIFH